MSSVRLASLPVIAIATSVVVSLSAREMSARDAEARWCTLVPGKDGRTRARRARHDAPHHLHGHRPDVRVQRPRERRDTLLVKPATPMPAGRVRLLQLDSATRAMLAGAGIADSQPVAFIRAAPYRADCRTIRWTDTIPFVVRGEVGYVRATLAPREQWVGAVPVLRRPRWLELPVPAAPRPRLQCRTHAHRSRRRRRCTRSTRSPASLVSTARPRMTTVAHAWSPGLAPTRPTPSWSPCARSFVVPCSIRTGRGRRATQPVAR